MADHEEMRGRACFTFITRPDICLQPRCMDTLPVDGDDNQTGVIHQTGIDNDLVYDHLIAAPHSKFEQWLRYLEEESVSTNFTRRLP